MYYFSFEMKNYRKINGGYFQICFVTQYRQPGSLYIFKNDQNRFVIYILHSTYNYIQYINSELIDYARRIVCLKDFSISIISIELG